MKKIEIEDVLPEDQERNNSLTRNTLRNCNDECDSDRLFYYDILHQYNERKYDGILTISNLSGDEIAIKNHITKEMEYFFPFKKDRVNYLLPSTFIDDVPLKILHSNKTQSKGKAFEVITNVASVIIKGQKLTSYKNFINQWCPFEHESPEEFILFKIITDTAYSSRINIRCISYPGWLKDSPLAILNLLRGDTFTVNKPTFAKLKWVINGNNKVVGLNEVQNLKAENISAMAKYYEDCGDFKTKFVSDSRASSGTSEVCDITNHSSMTFYNFPESERDNIFDDTFHPKIMSRIFPILLSGGSHTRTPCKEKFKHISEPITDKEYNELNDFLRVHKYYEEHGQEEVLNSPMKSKWNHDVPDYGNNRWQRNFDTIVERIKLYSETEQEFRQYVNLLYKMNQDYGKFVKNREDSLVYDVVEEEEEENPQRKLK